MVLDTKADMVVGVLVDMMPELAFEIPASAAAAIVGPSLLVAVCSWAEIENC